MNFGKLNELSPTGQHSEMLSFLQSLAQSSATPEEETMLAAVANTGGLISRGEALALYRLARLQHNGARILEIGSYRGTSSTAIGHAIKERDIELYCLDCWDDYYGQGFFEGIPSDNTPSDLEIFRYFLNNTAFVKDQLRILKGPSFKFKELLATAFFNLIFIDAAHDYDNVVQDINIAFKALLPGGIICGHDYHSDGHGVIEAVNDLIADDPAIMIKGLISGTSIWFALPGLASSKD